MNRGPMGIMFLVIIFSVLYAKVDGDNGIVKNVMKEGNDLPKEEVTQYKHLLECDHRHNFPDFSEWTFAYDIHCIETKDKLGKTTLTLSIRYDKIVFDNFEVTTCDREHVIKSIFPPEQKPEYSNSKEFELDTSQIPTVSYLTYKQEDGKCFTRKYKYANRVEIAAERFQPEEFDCADKSEWSKHGNVAVFANCRVRPEVLSKTVIGYSQGKPDWTPNDKEGKKHQRLLKCTFDQYSRLYDLKCVKGDKANEYFAFVYHMDFLLDRFTVVSCNEDDIVNGIFPMTETTANPKDKKNIWLKTIFFSMQDGNCYKRQYPEYNKKINTNPNEKIVPVSCPDVPERWTSPTWGKVGMWRECKVPKTKKKTDESEDEEEMDESENEEEMDESENEEEMDE